MSQLDYLKYDEAVIDASRNEALEELEKAKEFSNKYLRDIVVDYFGESIDTFREDPNDVNSAVDHNKIAEYIKNNARKLNMGQREIVAKRMAAKVNLKDKILLQKKELAEKILKDYATIVEDNNKIIEAEKEQILSDEKKRAELLAEQKAAEAKCESLQEQIESLTKQIKDITSLIDKETLETRRKPLESKKQILQEMWNKCSNELTENKGIIAKNEQIIKDLDLDNRKKALEDAINKNNNFAKHVYKNKKEIKEEYAKERTNLDDPDFQTVKQEPVADEAQEQATETAQASKGGAASGGATSDTASGAGKNLPVEYNEGRLAKNILKNFLADTPTPEIRRNMLAGRGWGDLVDALKHASTTEKRQVLEILNERREEFEEAIYNNPRYESDLEALLEGTLGSDYSAGPDYILDGNGMRNFDTLDAKDLREVKKILEKISEKRNELTDDEIKALEDKFLSPLRYSVLSYQCNQTFKDRLINNNFFVRFLGKNSVMAKRHEIISLIKNHNEISFMEENSISNFIKQFDSARNNINDLEYFELPESIRAGEISMEEVNPLSKKKAEREAR